VIQTDLAGNDSLASPGLAITIDTTDPTGSFSTAAFITNSAPPHTLTFTLSDTVSGAGIQADTDITVTDSVSGSLIPTCNAAG